MAEPAANGMYRSVKDPGEIIIGPSHASYAFSVLSGRTTGLATPSIAFGDSTWPEGYVVYVAWSKPSHLGGGDAGNGKCPWVQGEVLTPPGSQLRGFAIANAVGLYRAIGLAASHDSPYFNPIESREIPELTCTIGSLQRFRRLQEPMEYMWQQGTHGLALKKPNTRVLDSVPDTLYLILKEVPKALNWTLNISLGELLGKAGCLPDMYNCSTYSYGAAPEYTLWIFESCSATVSNHESTSFVNAVMDGVTPGTALPYLGSVVPNESTSESSNLPLLI